MTGLVSSLTTSALRGSLRTWLLVVLGTTWGVALCGQELQPLPAIQPIPQTQPLPPLNSPTQPMPEGRSFEDLLPEYPWSMPTEPSGGDCPCCLEPTMLGCREWPRVYTEIEAIFYGRSTVGGNQTIVLNQDTGRTLEDTNDLQFDFVGGPRALVSLLIDPVQAIQFGYFGLHTWQDSDTIRGDNDLSIPGDLAFATLDFFDADIMQVAYQSDFDSYEANYAHAWRGPMSLLAGFRYLDIRESFNLTATDNDAGTSNYRIRSQNFLYGGQVGARSKWIKGPWMFQAVGKGGLFGNLANQSNYVADFDNSFVIRNAHGSDTEFTVMTEFNASILLQLSKSIAIRAGYNFMWLNNVALATSQLDFTDTPTSGQGVFYDGLILHGANVGIEMHW